MERKLLMGVALVCGLLGGCGGAEPIDTQKVEVMAAGPWDVEGERQLSAAACTGLHTYDSLSCTTVNTLVDAAKAYCQANGGGSVASYTCIGQCAGGGCCSAARYSGITFYCCN
jgi:hypothetical protein